MQCFLNVRILHSLSCQFAAFKDRAFNVKFSELEKLYTQCRGLLQRREKYEKQCRVLRQQLAMPTKRVMMPVKAMKYKKTMKTNTSVRGNRAKCKAMKTMKAMKA